MKMLRGQTREESVVRDKERRYAIFYSLRVVQTIVGVLVVDSIYNASSFAGGRGNIKYVF